MTKRGSTNFGNLCSLECFQKRKSCILFIQSHFVKHSKLRNVMISLVKAIFTIYKMMSHLRYAIFSKSVVQYLKNCNNCWQKHDMFHKHSQYTLLFASSIYRVLKTYSAPKGIVF